MKRKHPLVDLLIVARDLSSSAKTRLSCSILAMIRSMSLDPEAGG